MRPTKSLEDKIELSSLFLAIVTYLSLWVIFLKKPFSLENLFGDILVILIIGAFVVGILYEIIKPIIEMLVSKPYEILMKAKEFDILKPKIASLESDLLELDRQKKLWEQQVKRDKLELGHREESLHKLADEKSKGFPWLADAYADYFELIDLQTSKQLERKKRPAIKAAEEVRRIAKEKRQAEKIARVLRYQIEYYEKLFPWLQDFKDENIDDVLIEISDEPNNDNNLDPACQWLSQSEYKNLSNAEKYQLALERYWKNRKTKWQIGRDYERYVGYLYELKGFNVLYQGAIEGFSDLGRDLIARQGKVIEVIQCKNWSKEKVIHEKHIFQLYGTVIAFELDNPKNKVKGVFVTSTQLSEKANLFARKLNIEVIEDFKLKRYPCIKCNISKKDGTRIYHLPFDQQYDKVSIEIDRGECYVENIDEAEQLGFRRAYRWIPND